MASPEEMAASMIANMPEKTGRALGDWLDIVNGTGHEKHGAIVKFLKTEHGMTHGFANLVAHKFREPAEQPDLVSAQYETKQDLRPIYDRLIQVVGAFGDDVEIAPKKSYVSLRRNKQFALVQPSTKTRVDIGLNLADAPTTERLEASGSFNGMVSHRVRIHAASEVDDELIGWLRQAYETA